MSLSEHPMDSNLYCSEESRTQKDLSKDTEFLASLLTWNNGYLSTMLNSVVATVDVESFLKIDDHMEKQLVKNQVNEKQKSSSTQISFQTTAENSEDFQSAGNPDHEESINGVLPLKAKTLVETAESAEISEIKDKKSETRGRKRSRRQRMDVVFKTVLRAIRRHYTRIFKTAYPQTRRLNQRPTILVQLNTMKSFVKEAFELKKDNDELVFFVKGLINNKLFDSCTRAGYVPPKLGKEVTEMFE